MLGSCFTEADKNAFKEEKFRHVVLMLLDKDSMSDQNSPFLFVNPSNQGEVGLRQQVAFFRNNIGNTLDLFSGKVGNEGWFAVTEIPNMWVNAGPTDNGGRNFLAPGPGLGAPNIDGEKDILLGNTTGVTPLRATGLHMLQGATVLAVLYEGDIPYNYSRKEANLKGRNLGIIAFEVEEIGERNDKFPGSLPSIKVKILDADKIQEGSLKLFSNAPEIKGIFEPFDVEPEGKVPPAIWVNAN